MDKQYEINDDKTRYDSYIFNEGLFAKQFKIKQEAYKKRHAAYTLSDDIVEVSDNFSGKVFNTGVMRHGEYFTIDTQALGNEQPTALKDILQPEQDVDEKYFVDDATRIEKFAYLRGPKKN